MGLSVILIHYRSQQSTRKCLDSLIRFMDVNPFEIILVDNGSETPFNRSSIEHHKEVRLERSDKNLGYAGGANFGIERSQYDLVLIINNDLEFTGPGLSKCCEILQKNDSIGALSCRINSENGDPQPVANRFNSIKNQLLETFRLQKLNSSGTWLLGGYFDHNSSLYCDWIWGTFFLTKREYIQSFDHHKLYDEFFLYQEDVAWGRQVKKIGKRVFYYSDYSVLHFKSKEVIESYGQEKRQSMINDNEHRFLIQSHGKFYSSLFYFFKSINFISKPSSKNFQLAKSSFSRIFSIPK